MSSSGSAALNRALHPRLLFPVSECFCIEQPMGDSLQPSVAARYRCCGTLTTSQWNLQTAGFSSGLSMALGESLRVPMGCTEPCARGCAAAWSSRYAPRRVTRRLLRRRRQLCLALRELQCRGPERRARSIDSFSLPAQEARAPSDTAGRAVARPGMAQAYAPYTWRHERSHFGRAGGIAFAGAASTISGKRASTRSDSSDAAGAPPPATGRGCKVAAPVRSVVFYMEIGS